LGPEQEIVGSNGEPICTVLGSKDFTEDTEGWIEPDAAFIVLAANCHEDLVRELEDCELSLKLDVDEWGSPRLKGTLANIRAALAKAKESRLQQQDLDEETP